MNSFRSNFFLVGVLCATVGVANGVQSIMANKGAAAAVSSLTDSSIQKGLIEGGIVLVGTNAQGKEKSLKGALSHGATVALCAEMHKRYGPVQKVVHACDVLPEVIKSRLPEGTKEAIVWLLESAINMGASCVTDVIIDRAAKK